MKNQFKNFENLNQVFYGLNHIYLPLTNKTFFSPETCSNQLWNPENPAQSYAECRTVHKDPN